MDPRPSNVCRLGAALIDVLAIDLWRLEAIPQTTQGKGQAASIEGIAFEISGCRAPPQS